MIVCLNTIKIQYPSAILERYCHLTNTVCVLYSIDYKAKSAAVKSNLPPIQINGLALNADMCLAQSNFAFISPDLEESLHLVKQTMQSAKTAYDFCAKLYFLKSAMWIFFNGLFMFHYSNFIGEEEYSKTVEKECSYGDDPVLCIGIQQDLCDQMPALSLTFTLLIQG